jgi:hypothetical protein
MSRDDIIRMAREAGMERVVKLHSDGTRTVELPHPDLLERFAALVAAAEREACAVLCEQEVCACCWSDDAQAAAEHLSERIRARGQA